MKPKNYLLNYRYFLFLWKLTVAHKTESYPSHDNFQIDVENLTFDDLRVVFAQWILIMTLVELLILVMSWG